MNRAQRRSAEKRLRRKGYSKGSARGMIELFRGHNYVPPADFSEDDKVMLDVEQIRKSKDFADMQQSYKDFVNENEGRVFTAHIESPVLVSLKEDPKWWFYSGDLLPAESAGEP